MKVSDIVTRTIVTCFLLAALIIVALSFTACRGPDGYSGVDGVSIAGPKGDPGADAQPCSALKIGSVATLSCPNSPSITISDGANGSNGVDGTNGTNGINGTNGTDATPVTIVQLCPGASNYGTFIEIGFCIGGNLYGTYSSNGGFSTLLAPGAYSSNAINSSCSFNVGLNCSIY